MSDSFQHGMYLGEAELRARQARREAEEGADGAGSAPDRADAPPAPASRRAVWRRRGRGGDPAPR